MPEIPITKAFTIDEVYGAVLQRPLLIEEMDDFYCNTDAVRSPVSARFQLRKMLERNAVSGRNGHYLFVGYRSCGKSTELNRLQKELDGAYTVLNYSVMKELDPQSIEYIELFIVTMQRLFKLAEEQDLGIDRAFLERIISWTQTKEIESIKDRHFSAEAEAGINAKFGIPYLHQFFLKLKGAAKASKSFKETIKNTLEPRLADLIQLCNELISEVRIQLVGRGKKDIVIFIEDLDKIPLRVAETIFFNYANQLTQLRATVVYSYPVPLFYNTNFGIIRSYFADVIELPMVKITHKDGTPYDEGVAVMKRIVEARISAQLFENDTVLPKFIGKTGGVIRDLFAMLTDAATKAEAAGKAMIGEEEYSYAYNYLKRDYENTIADYPDDKGGVKYTAVQLFQALAALVNNADKKPDNSEIMLLLRQNLCVLSYNGEGWCDVHPIVKDILRERGYIQAGG